jgi:hypothetical protein
MKFKSRRSVGMVALVGFALAALAACGGDADRSQTAEGSISEETSSSSSSSSSSSATTTTTTAVARSKPATAAAVLDALKAKGLPVAEIKVYNEADDVNSLMGRPGQYIGKANFHDSRLEASERFDASAGGSVEIFRSTSDAQRRAEYVTKLGESMPIFVEYDYLVDKVLLRLSSKLTPTQAKQYEAALEAIVG